jgi:myo-inositol-1(or 4)-monophosphatase
MFREVAIAEKAAKKAGEIIRSHLGTARVADKGLTYNLVTEADTAAERSIVETIHAVFPEDSILGEESSSATDLDSDRLWIVDPLDGTSNFAHGIPHFSVSIAFARQGKVECAVVYNPISGECFSAVRGGGAFCNALPIRVSTVPVLAGAVIGTGFYYERGPLMLKTLESMRKLLLADIQGIRRMGSAALDLCYVACGRYEGYFEYRLSVWDFAAGALIVTEAGGKCVDTDGVERGVRSAGMICSNGVVHEELFSLVK